MRLNYSRNLFCQLLMFINYYLNVIFHYWLLVNKTKTFKEFWRNKVKSVVEILFLWRQILLHLNDSLHPRIDVIEIWSDYSSTRNIRICIQPLYICVTHVAWITSSKKVASRLKKKPYSWRIMFIIDSSNDSKREAQTCYRQHASEENASNFCNSLAFVGCAL